MTHSLPHPAVRWAMALMLASVGAVHASGARATPAQGPVGQGTSVDVGAARAQIEQRYRHAVTVCQRQFAVNDCLQEARAARQQALQPVQEAEAAQALTQREERALQSRQRVQQKAQDHATLEAQRRSAALMAPPQPLQGPVEVKPPAPAASRGVRTGATIEQQRARDEAAAARRADDLQGRIRKSEAHRREVERRLLERAQQKPPAAPLPPSSSSPIPASGSSANR